MERAIEPWDPDLQDPEEREQLGDSRAGEGRMHHLAREWRDRVWTLWCWAHACWAQGLPKASSSGLASLSLQLSPAQALLPAHPSFYNNPP